jgi:antitoxin HigA-1
MITKRKPVHPGNVLKEDVLAPLGMTVTEAAADLGVTRKTLSELINEKASLSPEMAIRIAKATNTSPESWLNMQSRLDLWKSEQKELKVIPFPPYSDSLNELKEG